MIALPDLEFRDLDPEPVRRQGFAGKTGSPCTYAWSPCLLSMPPSSYPVGPYETKRPATASSEGPPPIGPRWTRRRVRPRTWPTYFWHAKAPNAPTRYRLADRTLRLFHVFVSPYTSLLERSDPRQVYAQVVAPRLDTFMGLAFEDLVAPTYERLRDPRVLPLVERWSRWEGRDRSGRSLEVDVVAPLVDKRLMTGAVKYSRTPIGPSVFYDHLAALQRAADAGLKWAHRAMNDGPLIFMSASGFTERFADAANAYKAPVLAWSLQDVYSAA